MSTGQTIEITVVTCNHPTIQTCAQVNRFYRGYACTTCGKKIEIPETTMIQWGKDAQEKLAGIMGLAFGQKWATLARQGKV